jgi:NAD(P)H-dependent FMN reductase
MLLDGGTSMTTYKVGYLIGSLAKASINRKLATALVRLAPAELDMVSLPRPRGHPVKVRHAALAICS